MCLEAAAQKIIRLIELVFGKKYKNALRNAIWKLTDLCFLPFAPIIGPRLAADEDGWFDVGIVSGWKEDGPPKDCEGNEEPIFCFFREAETEGLGIGSCTG